MPKDIKGREFAVGQTVVRAERRGSSGAYLEFREVLKIVDDKVYLKSRFPAPLRYPEAVMILNDA